MRAAMMVGAGLVLLGMLAAGCRGGRRAAPPGPDLGAVATDAPAPASTGQAPAIVPEAPDALLFGATALAPLEYTAALLGAEVDQSGNANITLTRGAHTFTYFPESRQVYSGLPSKLHTQKVRSFLRADVLYFPVRPLVELLGGTLQADAQTITATFADPPVTLRLPVRPQRGTFSRFRDDDAEIYLMRLDGSELQRLTCNTVDDHFPALSPDGKTLFSCRDWTQVIRRAVDDPAGAPFFPSVAGAMPYYNSLSLTPDGRHLLFTRDNIICLANADGSNLREITEGAHPRFSPDGAWIAYHRDDRDMDGKVLLMDAQGRRSHVVADGYYPSFSADGRTLYVRDRQYYHGTTDERKLRCFPFKAADGTLGKMTVPIAEATASEEAFSADGRHLVYCRRDRQPGIFLADADGRHPRRLTRRADDASPRFTPDGTRILFYRDRGLYSIRTDGSELVNLTAGLPIAIFHDFTITPDGARLLLVITPDQPLPENDLGV